MNKVANLKQKRFKRHYGLYEALSESLREVKLYEEGKIQLKTWDELYKELKNIEEGCDNI